MEELEGFAPVDPGEERSQTMGMGSGLGVGIKEAFLASSLFHSCCYPTTISGAAGTRALAWSELPHRGPSSQLTRGSFPRLGLLRQTATFTMSHPKS